MIRTDYHVHSCFSGDSQTPSENMIQKAIELQMTHLCFTEHNDPFYPYEKGTPQNIFDLNTDEYLPTIKKLADKYHNSIKIYHGVELGIQPDIIDTLNTYATSYPFDFIIASEHVCHHKDPYYPSFYEGITEKQAYREYFEEMLLCLQNFSHYDVLGHLDYIVRYGPNKNKYYSYSVYSDIIDEILRFVIQNGKGIEVNAGGYRNKLGVPNPTPEILKRYRELGGEIISIGSDAHSPEYLQDRFNDIAEILTAAGYRYYTIFHNRKPEFISL